MADHLLVRIRPYNPRAGARVQTYTYKGVRFRESAGWYKIEKDLAEELRDIQQDESDPLSMPVFDVLSEEQAAKIEEREQQRRDRASAMRPNVQPNLRANDPRRALAQSSVTSGAPAPAGVFPAPNDEIIPNGYPPPRVYPMPQPTGTLNQANFLDAPAVEEQVPDDAYVEAAQKGVDDRTLSVSGANIARDQQGMAPVVIDGQGTIEDGDNFNLATGDTDFGPDNPEGSEEESAEGEPASPPARRRRRT